MEELDETFWAEYMGEEAGDGVYDRGVASTKPYQQLLKEVFTALALAPGMSVLDAGSGTGNLVMKILEAQPDIGRIYAVERFEPAMSAARRKTTDERVRFVLEDACGPSLTESVGEVDRVVCVNALYAFAAPGLFRDSVVRVLKPGGLFVCTNAYRPNMAWPLGEHELWLALQASKEEYQYDLEHVRPWRVKAIQMNARIAKAMRGAKLNAWSPEELTAWLGDDFDVLEMRDNAYGGINTFFVARKR